jgi:hypothetical protein
LAQVIILSGGQKRSDHHPKIQRHLGAYRIATELNNSGYTVAVIDYVHLLSCDELITTISKHLDNTTLWVGISSTFLFDFDLMHSFDIQKMYQNIELTTIDKLYSYIKQNSNAKIVFGGAKAQIHHFDSRVDYYISGYADNSIIDVTDHISGKRKSPMALNWTKLNDGSIFIDSIKYEEPDINHIDINWNLPNFNLLPQEGIPLEFARGCIFKCKFCSYPLLGKKKGTYVRDLSKVRDEMIQLWETNKTDTFYITDDTFNDDNDKIMDIHKLFTSLPFKPKFTAFLRLDLINRFPEQADILLESGLIGNWFGIESFNHRSAKSIGKGLHPDKVKETLSWVKDKWKGKVNTTVGLILGLPHDTYEYFDELFQYIHSSDYKADRTTFSPLYIADKTRGYNPYASEFSKNYEQYGYNFDNNGKWYNNTTGLSYDICQNISNNLADSISDKMKVSDFDMITFLNCGVSMEDMLHLTEYQIYAKYDFNKINEQKLLAYKQMIGL